MSYILEALRRAEVERQRGAVPGLHAQPMQGAWADSGPGGPDEVGRRWRWPLLAGSLAALLGLAAGLGWWLKPAPERALVAGKRVLGPTLPTGPIPTSVAALPAALAAPNTPQAPAATPVPAPPVAPTAVPTVPTRLPAPATSTAPATPSTPTVMETAASAVSPKSGPPVGSALRPTLLPAPTTAAEARLPTLAELPEALRRELQPLSLGGLVYAEQPALRIAIVNGQVFHEGDKPMTDLLVQQIRPKSVVFGFRGQRFEVAL